MLKLRANDTWIKSSLENVCVEVPQINNFDMHVEITDGPQIYGEQEEQWVSLGHPDDITGVHLRGRTTRSGDNMGGSLRLKQFIASTRSYYFEEWDGGSYVGISAPRVAGNLNVWYSDVLPNQQAGDYVPNTEFGSCNGTSWVYYHDAPSSPLGLAEWGFSGRPTPSSLLERFTREDRFQTFLVWVSDVDPSGTYGIPIAMVEWGWKVTAEAEQDSGAEQLDYPFIWKVTESSTDPLPGVQRSATDTSALGLRYPYYATNRWDTRDYLIFDGWSSYANLGRTR